MILNAVHDDTLLTRMPRTMAALREWDGKDLREEAVYAALAGDLKESSDQMTAAEIVTRINCELPGAISEVTASASKASTLTSGPYKAALIEISPLWGRHDVWTLLKRGTSAYTTYYLLRSIDYQYGPDGQIVPSPRDTAIFQGVFLRTLASVSASLLRPCCWASRWPISWGHCR